MQVSVRVLSIARPAPAASQLPPTHSVLPLLARHSQLMTTTTTTTTMTFGCCRCRCCHSNWAMEVHALHAAFSYDEYLCQRAPLACALCSSTAVSSLLVALCAAPPSSTSLGEQVMATRLVHADDTSLSVSLARNWRNRRGHSKERMGKRFIDQEIVWLWRGVIV